MISILVDSFRFKLANVKRKLLLINYNLRSFLLSDEFLSLRGCFYFIKEIKKLVPRALLSYISRWEFSRTLEKSEKHSPSAIYGKKCLFISNFATLTDTKIALK